MNATEMEKSQLITETWKAAAQEVIAMLVTARDPNNLKIGLTILYLSNQSVSLSEILYRSKL